MKYSITLIALVLFSACSGKEQLDVLPTVEIKTIEIKRPAPTIPEPTPLELKDVSWDVISKETVDSKLNESPVYYGLTEEEYKHLSLNISALRAYIQQQIVVIKKYKDSYSDGYKNQ